MKKWKLLESTIVFDHPWYKVGKYSFEVAPGKIINDYFLGIFEDAAYVVAFTENGKLILVRQYKAGANAITLEVPAGYMKKGESPLKAAKRELLEETGYKARIWKKIGKFYSNPTKERGGCLHLFIAEGAYWTTKQNFDEGENIEICFLSPRDVLKKIEAGKINVTGSTLAILLALR